MKKVIRKIGLITLLISSNVFAAPAVFEDFSDSLSVQKFDGTEQVMEISLTGELLLSSREKSYLPSIPRSNMLFLRETGSIETFSADLKVTELSLGNAETQQAILRMAGTYYSTESTNTRVWVGLHIGDRGNGLEAWYEILNDTHDGNDQYVSSITTAEGSLELEGLTLDTTYPASIIYDGDTGFTFVFNNGAPVTVSGPAKTGETPFWKGVGTRFRFGQNNSTPDIYEDETSDDGSTVNISGTVDNVSTNIADLGDDFSAANLDKWNRVPTSAVISESGQLEMAIAHTGTSRETARVRINQEGLKYIGATATLSSDSEPSETARIRARITNYLGNDTYDESVGDTANGFEGNIWTQLVVERRADGSFRVFAYAERADNAAYDLYTQVFFQELDTGSPVAYDVPYELAIDQNENLVNYIVNGETLFTFDLNTSDVLSGNLYDPVKGFSTAQLNTRIQDGPGRAVAIFDDVITDLMPATITLNGTNSDDQSVALSDEVIANVGELVTLVANAANASDIIRYVWEQIGGPNVDITTVASRASPVSSNLSARVVSTENTLSFTVPAGSDTQDLAFRLTTVNTSGLETEEDFTVAVDNSQASTLSPDTNPVTPTTPASSGGGGGSFNFFFIFMLLLTFTAKLKLRSEK